jgi:uncharacterized membrane protein HdeD (DUF308 family)
MTAVGVAELRALGHLHPSRRRPALALGAAMLALALVALLHPQETTWAVGAAGGWLLWMAGALMLGFSLLVLSSTLRVIGVVTSLIAVALGAYLTYSPTAGAVAVAVLIAAALVSDGSLQFAAALHLHPLQVWRWLFASSLTSLGAAGIVTLSLTGQFPDPVPLALCAALGSSGVALIALSFVRAAPGR